MKINISNWVTQKRDAYRAQVLKKISEMEKEAMLYDWAGELDMDPITVRGHVKYIIENNMASNLKLIKKTGRWFVVRGENEKKGDEKKTEESEEIKTGETNG